MEIVLPFDVLLPEQQVPAGDKGGTLAPASVRPATLCPLSWLCCLDDPEDGHELQPGEILATKQTNIGWTFYPPACPDTRYSAAMTDVRLAYSGLVLYNSAKPAHVRAVAYSDTLEGTLPGVEAP